MKVNFGDWQLEISGGGEPREGGAQVLTVDGPGELPKI